MIRRLTIAALALGLASCSEPAPEKAAAPAATVAATPAGFEPTASPTLERVRRRGWVACGVHPGLPGFAFPDARGGWRGFDVDLCRAVAAAVLGEATKVRFTPVTAAARFDALRRGDIDILSRNTSQTLARDAGLGLTFPATTYYDGQGVLVARSLGLTSVEELGGARICVQAGTVSEGNLRDFFTTRDLRFRPVVLQSEDEARRTYETEGCDAFTADISALAASRALMANPASHMILPDPISREPLGPVVRQDDPAWADIVRWTVAALVLAEEKGLTSRTVEAARREASDPETRRLLGVEGELGPLLGLSGDWAYQVVRQVGSYGEVFRRNLGEDSGLKLARGLNALWNAPAPGLMYAAPIR